MLCTLWDPIVFTSMEYIKFNHFFKDCDVYVTPFETNDLINVEVGSVVCGK